MNPKMGGGGLLPWAVYTGPVCVAPKGKVFKPFWSERMFWPAILDIVLEKTEDVSYMWHLKNTNFCDPKKILVSI